MAAGEEISYVLIRKNVKNINLRVKRDGSGVLRFHLSKRRRPECSKMQNIA